jgi:hypothetical protein
LRAKRRKSDPSSKLNVYDARSWDTVGKGVEGCGGVEKGRQRWGGVERKVVSGAGV